jgi:hypothetical protein
MENLIKSRLLVTRDLFTAELIVLTLHRDEKEVERLTEIWNKEECPNRPGPDFLQNLLKLFKKALPDTVRYGVDATASTLPVNLFEAYQPTSTKQQILTRLMEMWFETGEVEHWTQARSAKSRKKILCDYLEAYMPPSGEFAGRA